MLGIQTSRISRWLQKRFDLIGYQGLTLIDDVLPTLDVDTADVVQAGTRGERYAVVVHARPPSVGNFGRLVLNAQPGFVLHIARFQVNAANAGIVRAGLVLPFVAAASQVNVVDERFNGTVAPLLYTSADVAAGGLVDDEGRFANGVVASYELPHVVAPGQSFAFVCEPVNTSSDWTVIVRCVPITAQEVAPA